MESFWTFQRGFSFLLVMCLFCSMQVVAETIKNKTSCCFSSTVCVWVACIFTPSHISYAYLFVWHDYTMAWRISGRKTCRVKLFIAFWLLQTKIYCFYRTHCRLPKLWHKYHQRWAARRAASIITAWKLFQGKQQQKSEGKYVFFSLFLCTSIF